MSGHSKAQTRAFSRRSADVHTRVDALLAARRSDGSLPEAQWVAIMARLHPDGFLDGYTAALSRPGKQGALV